MTILEAQAVSKHFAPSRRGRQRSGASVVRAVDAVSLALRRGEIFGLLGQSGAGKTTLARLLLLLTTPTSGRIFFEGEDLAAGSKEEQRRHLRRRARLLFQHPDAALNPAFSVARVLDQALRTHTNLPPAERRDRATALLHEVDLAPALLARYPHALSAGEKRRVGLARALATDPVLLIADEPVAGLDAAGQRHVLRLLQRLRHTRGLTLLLIGHDVDQLHATCDRLGVMYAGRLVETGTRAEMTPATCRHPYTRALFDARLTAPPPAADLPAPQPPAATGCAYRPSCPRWMTKGGPARCTDEVPPLERLREDHAAACHFAEAHGP